MRKLAWFSFSFGAAAAIAVGLLGAEGCLISGAAAVIVLAMLLLVRRGWSRAAVAALGLAAGFFWTAAYNAIWIAPAQPLDDTQREITITLTEDPTETSYGASVCGTVEIDGRRFRTLLYGDDKLLDCRVGDTLALTAYLKMNGAESDMALYYRADGIKLIATQERAFQLDRPEQLPLRFWPVVASRALKQVIGRVFSEDAVGLMQALLAGDRSKLSYQVRNHLSLSGIAHTVAISGMHVAILLGIVLQLTGKRRGLSAIIGIPIVVFYTLQVGATPSVVRAAVMQAVILVAPLAKRESDPATTLSAAFLLMTAQNPWVLYSLSFRLSFASLVGIFLFAERIYGWFMRFGRTPKNAIRSLHWLIDKVLLVASSTISATVFTVPLIAFSFEQVSLLAVVTNVLTLWAITLLFQLGLVASLLGFVWLAPARLLGWVLAFLVRYVLAVAGWIAESPFASVYTQSVYIVLWLWFCYLALGVFLFHSKEGKRPLPLLCTIVLTLCLCLILQAVESDRGSMRLQMLDVGQGQCLVYSSEGSSLMIDCGGSNADDAGETAARALLSDGRMTLDALVLTHYDADHAGGVPQLLSRVNIGCIYLPDVPDERGLRQQIEQLAASHGIQLQYVTRDLRLKMGDAAVRIFAPVSQASDNDACLSVLCSVDSYDLLVTGDMTTNAERILLDIVQIPKLELLVAGHHGAATSTGDLLLEQTRPEVVLISVGYNPYGHPNADTLARIEATGAQIFRTDECGTIIIRR